MTAQPIALESCLSSQKTQPVFESVMKKIVLVLGFRFLVSDVISEVGF